jgi:hypothetical protein
MVECSGQCINPDTDEDYCGASGPCLGYTTCTSGQICNGGMCVPNCQPGLVICYGKCVDIDTDEDYCGSCDNPCESGEICSGGACESCGTYYDAAVPKTWQTTSDADYDDGYYQKGVPWPNPRFANNGNGTVTDNLTGLIWTKSSSCSYQTTWDDALSDCNGLGHGQCGLTDGSIGGDWRLANINELFSLVDQGQSSPALPPSHPFTDVILNKYLSSTAVNYNNDAWGIHMGTGEVETLNKGVNHYFWCVRGGQ